jgi:hypothetical protein
VFPWAHLMAHSHSRERCRCRHQLRRLCLVRGVTDKPEQWGARRRGVLVASPGSLAVAANLAVRIELSHPLN